MFRMDLWKKIGRNTKNGLAVLVAGAMIGIGGMAYAKEVNNEGWSVPGNEKYGLLAERNEEISCEYEGKKVGVKVKVESYSNFAERKIYFKFSFEGQVFMYQTIESLDKKDAYNIIVLMDRDGNGSLETKYKFPEDEEEMEKEGVVPEWVLEKVTGESKA